MQEVTADSSRIPEYSRFRRRLWQVIPRTPFGVASFALGVIIALLVLFPVGRVVFRALFPEGQFNTEPLLRVLTSPWLPGVLKNTFLAVGAAGVIAVVTASAFAWLNERTDARLGLVGDVLPLVPLLVPAIAMAIGWIFLGTEGIGFINVVSQNLGLPLRVNIASWPGLIFVYSLYFVPFVYLVVAAALRNVDPALEEASRLSGAGILTTLRRVSLPTIGPAVVGAGLLVVIVGMSLFSVPSIIATRAGIDILSVRIIRALTFSFPPRMDEAVILSTFMLLAILSMWAVQVRVQAKGRFATIGGRSARAARIPLGKWKWFARVGMIFYLTLTSILPLVGLLIVSLQPFWSPNIDFSTFSLDHFERVLFDRPITRNAFRNSLQLGTIGGLLGMVVAGVMAIYIAKVRGFVGRTLDGVTKLPATLSNIVIALGFLLTFSGPPFGLHGTFVLLLMVYLIIYMPQASVASGSAVAQVGNELAEASYVAGAGEARTVRRVMFPLMLPGLVSGWALLFVLMAGDLQASALLAGVRSPVIGFVILDIWENGTYGPLAALATSFVLVTSTVVLAVMKLTRRRR